MRLIDADALMDEANSDGAYGYVDAKQISEAPTEDAVPVVRCRECKHRGIDDCIFHIKGEPADEELLLKLDNDFCSYGKRKGG